MRKSGGELYGRALEKKVLKAIRELFADGLSSITISDIKTQLQYTGHSDPELLRRVRYAVHNLHSDGDITIEKKPGHREMPTIHIIACLDKLEK